MKLIPLTQGKFAQVDDEDYDFLMQWKWYAGKGKIGNYYANRAQFVMKGKNKYFSMHRQILGITDKNLVADHIDGDGLNNQRSNLRIANATQNATNRKPNSKKISQYKGVQYDKTRKTKKWVAYIEKYGVKKNLGRFITEIEAAQAYNDAAIAMNGEYAYINKILISSKSKDLI